MEEREIDPRSGEDVCQAVEAFYDAHPYPPPAADLDAYRQRWLDENRRKADFHLHFPGKSFRRDFTVLVAGCGTSQAAKNALRQPQSQVVGIDFSAASVRHTLSLKQKYHLTNLEIHQLPLEQAGELGHRFDKIVCTGVLHHLPDPQAGLRALREVLAPEGAMHLMVYAPYGRAGVYLLQEYCRRLGIGHTEKEIRDLANTLQALPHAHPLARLLGQSPDFASKAGLADALLNPQDRAYSVPELFDLLDSAGLSFGRWVRQAPYLPQCGSLASTPHAARLAILPIREQYAALELFRGTMLRHSLIVYRDGFPDGSLLPDFSSDHWEAYVPVRLPDTILVQEGRLLASAHLPPGKAAALINQNHTDSDLVLPITASEVGLVKAIDGDRTIGDIIRQVSISETMRTQTLHSQARSLFEQLWRYDQIVFDRSVVG